VWFGVARSIPSIWSLLGEFVVSFPIDSSFGYFIKVLYYCG
jgi:hypothetical protein